MRRPEDLSGWERGRPEIEGTVGRDDGYDDPSSYSHLPTTFSAWYDSLSAADKRKFETRLVEEAGPGDRQLSQREIDALLMLVRTEIDSLFASEELTADERRRAIAEIAIESGVGLDTDRKYSLSPDEAIFGRDDSFGDADNGYNGWEPIDPTDPNGDFGRPDDGKPRSDIDTDF